MQDDRSKQNQNKSFRREKQKLTWASGTLVSIDERDTEYKERRCLTSVFNVAELSVGKEASKHLKWWQNGKNFISLMVSLKGLADRNES